MSGNPRVLIVDDHPIDRRLPARVLRAKGWDCEEAENGEEALAKLSAVRFDAVLLDIGLPDISGYELCLRIRANPALKHLWVVAYTALASSEVAPLASGFNGLLIKPITPDQLFDVLKGAQKPCAAGCEAP